MTYLGKVKNGVVVLDGATGLADGTVVRIEPIEADAKAPGDLASRLRKLAGTATGLPKDMAKNHSLYLHGHERK